MTTEELRQWISANGHTVVETDNRIEFVDDGFSVEKKSHQIELFENSINDVRSLKIMEALVEYALTPINER